MVSADGSAAVVTVQLSGQSTTVTAATKDALLAQSDALRSALPSGSEVALGGDLYTKNVPAVSLTEGIGLLVALVVLLITFGSFMAAGMPILTALLGVALSVAVIFAATAVTTISSTTPMLALMLGLAVGIDYALFIISRHRDQLRGGMDPEESAARALATAGSAVVFAGMTVMIALVGLSVANIPFLTTMGIAGAGAVGIAVALAMTLTPALLGFAGTRLRPRGAGDPAPHAARPALLRRLGAHRHACADRDHPRCRRPARARHRPRHAPAPGAPGRRRPTEGLRGPHHVRPDQQALRARLERPADRDRDDHRIDRPADPDVRPR